MNLLLAVGYLGLAAGIPDTANASPRGDDDNGPSVRAESADNLSKTMATPRTNAGAPTDDGESRRLEIYGFVHTDGIYDFNRVDPLWRDTLRPSKIPTEAGVSGGDGEAIFSIRQTRLGTVANGTLAGQPYEAKFEFNLFGTGDNAGETTFRLRHAYASWGPILVGQTWTLFMDNDVSPTTLDFSGPVGITSIRNRQLRYTIWDKPHLRAAVALEKPDDSIDPGNIRQIDPDLGANLKPRETVPDLTGQIRWVDDWGHMQIAGVLREVGFETPGAPGNQPAGEEIGWGLNFGSRLLFEGATIRIGAVYGEGIGSYMNDGGTDLAPRISSELTGEAVALPILGLNAYADIPWSRAFTTTIGYGVMEIDNSNFQNGSALHRGEYASANLLWRPNGQIMTGAELSWGRRTDKDGDTGSDIRIQYSFRFTFSSGDLLVD